MTSTKDDDDDEFKFTMNLLLNTIFYRSTNKSTWQERYARQTIINMKNEFIINRETTQHWTREISLPDSISPTFFIISPHPHMWESPPRVINECSAALNVNYFHEPPFVFFTSLLITIYCSWHLAGFLC